MQQTLMLPYLRSSPVHIPRRDLVLSASDSLTLRVTVVESDNPSAQLVLISGGVGGPAARLVIWSDYAGGGQGRYYGWSAPSYGFARAGWDYGWSPPAIGSVLWCGMGDPQVGLGSFDFFIPFMTFSTFPERCGFAVQLSWDSGRKSDLLAKGTMQVSGPNQEMQALTALLTDSLQPITTDDDTPFFA
jgi:hypothetical protein